MKGNFDRALARVLVYEGGYSNDPDDPGGSTMKGVTQGTYNSWRSRQGKPLADVRSITSDELAAIYKQDYWDRVDGDDLPSGVDFCLFDAAVNSGVGGATKWAQATASTPVDGDWGPKTKAAVLADDPEDFIRDFCARRLGTLQRLKTWKKFGKGWSARIANVQKTALAWAQASDIPTAPKVSEAGGQAKARMTDIPVSKTSTMVAHVGTVGGVVATGATQLGQSLTSVPTDGPFQWVKYALGTITIAGAIGALMVTLSKQKNDAAAASERKATVDPDADADVTVAEVKTNG